MYGFNKDELLEKLKDIKYKTHLYKKVKYINKACGFDIETTSTYINKDEKFAFMYIWTFGLDINGEDYIFYGRTWEEFISLINDVLTPIFKLNENTLVVYIHNLGYEFQFMRKYFKWVEVFASEERKPIKARTENNIEFRDSLILSGANLAITGKNLLNPLPKLKGDLDYTLIRHQKTEMSEKELKYCEYDVKIILEYIREQIDIYKNIVNIPLTNTGRVRKDVKNRCLHSNTNHRKENGKKYSNYRKLMKSMTISNVEEYERLKRAFSGGFTHANARKVDSIIKDVHSIDFTSSYPAVMVSEKFPMNKGEYIKLNNISELENLSKNYCIVFEACFKNIEVKDNINDCYISSSKCYKSINVNEDNGRVFSADEIYITLTEIDFSVIKNTYQWGYFKIGKAIKYYKNYLPEKIIESVLKYYKDKTELKGVQGKEVEYLISKGMLNSLYGMSVTDIIRDNIKYTDNWNITAADKKELLEKYNNNANRFLFYAWGIYVTAYARRNLWLGITNIGDDYIYSDTDSIKFTNFEKHKKFIDTYNNFIISKINACLEYRNIDSHLREAKTIKGVVKPLGVWDYEGKYKYFKTLGAKRYMFITEKDELIITIAGLGKQEGAKYLIEKYKSPLKALENFNNNLYIPADKTGKNTHTYIDEEKEAVIIDYKGEMQKIKSLSAVHLEPAEFTLSMSDKYINFLDNYIKGFIFKGVKELC